MQLTYRGVSYTYNPTTVETIETETTARFRGQAYSIHRPVQAPSQTMMCLNYRGVTYISTKPTIVISHYPQINGDFMPAFNG